jgi:transcriptional antiterminator NusG
MAEQEHQEEGQWFVVHALSGQEFKVQQSIARRRILEGVEDVIFQVEVPTEKVSETRGGRKMVVNRKFFPGYILVRMKLFDEDGGINDRAWYFIRETQGVIGLVGGQQPVALSPSEVNDIMAQARQAEEGPRPKIEFEVGETVTIKDGAFENFEGVIENVDADRGKLRLSVTIFGRSTPVEVECWQVERTS